MRALKVIATLAIVLVLSGCANGYIKKTPLKDTNGDVVKSSYFFGLVNRVVYQTERKSRTAVLAEESTKQIEAISEQEEQKTDQCEAILDKTPDTAAGQAEQFRSFSDCISSTSTTDLVAITLGRPTSDIQSVTQQTSRQVQSVQDGLTNRVLGVTKSAQGSITALVAGSVVRSSSRHRRDENIAAVENSGDTTVGSVSVNGDTSTADSNDGGSAGEGGSGGSGSGASGVTGTEQTIVNIGGNVNAGVASEDAGVLAGTDTSQLAEPSATTSLVNDANVDQANAIDDNNAVLNNNPSNGVIGQ